MYSNLEFHTVEKPHPFVLHVQFNRPKVLNAIHGPAYREYGRIISAAGEDADVRAIVVSGVGKAFCAGLDVKNESGSFIEMAQMEQSRRGIHLNKHIKEFQQCISAPYFINKPVIAVAHGPCIGLAIDILTACDVRFATDDALFSVREIEIGMAADIGTLQRLPKIVGDQGWVKDVCFTGRNFKTDEAHKVGLVQYTHSSKDAAVDAALKYANELAKKSPVAMFGTKRSIQFAYDHSHQESLDQIADFNSYGLGEDFMTGSMSFRSKDKPEYSKL